LAAVARGLAARDPQRNPEAAGLAASDRNAELLLKAPFDLSTVDTPRRHRVEPEDEARRMRRRDLLRSLVSFS